MACINSGILLHRLKAILQKYVVPTGQRDDLEKADNGCRNTHKYKKKGSGGPQGKDYRETQNLRKRSIIFD